MGITGNLKTMELAELLQWLSQSQKTGTLVVDNGKVQKQIFFRDGMIISSASTDPREHLGAFLVSHGFITDLELQQAVKMQESNKMLLGKILVTIGAISEQDLHRMLRLKAEEGIYDVFTWPEGAFRFLDNQLPAHNMVPISLDVPAIVLEGMQRLDEWRRIREEIPHMNCIPVSVGPWEESVMTEGAPQILALVDDQRTIEEICKLTHSSEFHVCRILFRQVRMGRLKIVKLKPSGSDNSGPTAALPPSEPSVPSAESLLRQAQKLVAQGELEMGLRHLRAARALEPESRALDAEALKLEGEIRKAIESVGVRPEAVPVLGRRMEELAQLRLSPQEGFLLTRIDGVSNLQAILKLTPLPPLEAQLLFWKLHRAGHVKFQTR
jgi:hypothetical protein